MISTLASYAKINKYGFIETPYRKVNNSIINESDVRYLTADEEKNYIIAQAKVQIGEDGRILDEQVIARHLGENIMRSQKKLISSIFRQNKSYLLRHHVFHSLKTMMPLVP